MTPMPNEGTLPASESYEEPQASQAHKTLEASAEIAEPVEPGTSETYLGGWPLRRYILWSTIAGQALTTMYGATVGILLPNQVQALEFARWFTGANAHVDLTTLNNLKAAVAGGVTTTPAQQRLLDVFRQFDTSRAQALSLIASLPVLCGIFLTPTVGMFSDRTRSRLGRRTPWMLFGGIVGACLLVGVRFAPTVAILVLLWTVMQAVLGMASGPLGATVADRIPESRLGTVSAISGLGNLVGGLMGAVIAGAAFASLGLNLYFLFAGFIIVGVVGFVLLVKDRPSTALRVSPQSWRGFFRGFLTPLLDGDFRWVWIARVILFFGYANSTALSFYMLQSYITPALSAAEATRLAPMLTLAGVPGTVLAVAFAGRLSDKLGRRKPFVIAASLLMTVAMAVPLLSPTLIALYINAILIGIALGIYLPVDQALLIDVLPDKNAAGRDLGIGALGINIGQALGPILAAQVVALTGSYGLVWGAALVLTLGAAVVILPIKRVR